MKTFRALAVGDVVGRCGREALERGLAELQWQQDVMLLWYVMKGRQIFAIGIW